jgi:hypothetical protein
MQTKPKVQARSARDAQAKKGGTCNKGELVSNREDLENDCYR